MTRRGLTRRAHVLLGSIAALLIVVGATALVIAFRAQREAPRPPPDAAGSYGRVPTSSTSSSPFPPPTGSSAPSAPPTQGPETHGPVLPGARPTQLRIPAIGVHESLIELGLDRNRQIEVPPLSEHSQPGWYRNSPAPGQLGPSIILGHVDSARYGPAVFFKLGALRKGDTVDITRADHVVAVFRIDAVAQYPKNEFPSLTVYGNTDHAALRLITCGGSFDSSSGNYRDNIIAFASLVSSHPA